MRSVKLFPPTETPYTNALLTSFTIIIIVLFIGSYAVHHLVVHQVVNFQNRCKGTTKKMIYARDLTVKIKFICSFSGKALLFAQLCEIIVPKGIRT